MTKLKTLDKDACEVVRRALSDLIDSCDFENDYGFHVAVGNMTYSGTQINVKLAVSLVGEGGEVQTREREDFVKRAEMFYKMKPTDLDRSFTNAGETFVLVGCKPKSYKYPMLCQRTDGKLFKFPADVVRRALSPLKAVE